MVFYFLLLGVTWCIAIWISWPILISPSSEPRTSICTQTSPWPVVMVTSPAYYYHRECSLNRLASTTRPPAPTQIRYRYYSNAQHLQIMCAYYCNMGCTHTNMGHLSRFGNVAILQGKQDHNKIFSLFFKFNVFFTSFYPAPFLFMVNFNTITFMFFLRIAIIGWDSSLEVLALREIRHMSYNDLTKMYQTAAKFPCSQINPFVSSAVCR